MDEKKPNNFKEAALSHIPPGIIDSMLKQTAVSEKDLQELHDVVLKRGPEIHANIPGNKAPISLPKPEAAKPATLSYAIEGHVIAVPLDSAGAAIQLFYTLLAFVWSTDKKVAKILKQFDFKFYDANGKQIYPKVKSGKK